MIADDLTGACDAGVAFALRGFRTSVQLVGPGADLGGVEMAVLPTFSRDDDPSQARRKVEKARADLARGKTQILFKKIDSTWKGNLAVEISALLESGGFSAAVVAPAFPAMGRTVVGGVLHLAGEPTSLHLPSLLAGVSGAQPKDATTDQELREIAAAALSGGGRVLCVGSGGLAAQLAELLAERLGRTPPGHEIPAPRGPALFVLGSEQPVTRTQLDYLLRTRPALGLTASAVNSGSVREAFRQHRHLVVTVDLDAADERDAARLIESAPDHLASGLVVSGGDTAEWICRAAAVETIELRGEVLAGIPWGEAVTASGKRWCIVTKAGGFGAESALAAVADFLSGENKKRAS